MVDFYRRQSPLAKLGLQARVRQNDNKATVSLSEQPFRGQITLRGDTANAAFAKGVKKVFGLSLPEKPNTAGQHRQNAALWLGPDEWLIVVPDGREGKLLANLDKELANVHFAASDVSNSRVVLQLSGADARNVLAKGCSLDLHPSTFSDENCAQSSLARCHVLLHQVDDLPSFDVYVHRSFAGYAWAWLADAAADYTCS